MRSKRTARPRRVMMGILLAGCLAAGWAPVSSGVQGPDCSQYSVRGIAPGMRLSEVRKRMGGGEAVAIVPGDPGPRTGVTYAVGDASIYVLYDRDVSKDPDARVALVRAHGRPNRTEPLAFVRSIVGSFGDPLRGRENLESGLRTGTAVWRDDACGIEVTAFRQQPKWWMDGEGDLCVQIEPVRVAGAAASGTESVAAREDTEDAVLILVPSFPEPRAETPAPEAAATPQAPPAPEPPPAPQPAGEQEPPGSPSADGTPPIRIPDSYVPPHYPDLARQMRLQAKVLLRVDVRRDGSVGEVGVLEATRTGLGFEEAAVQAAKKWRYQPATRGGEPEDATLEVWVVFE